MTKLLDQAFMRVKTLPPETQDEAARMLLTYFGDEGPLLDLTLDEEASLQKSFEQATRGPFATDEEVRSVWAKHGL